MGLELEGVGRLVEGDPGPERADRHAQRSRRRADVLLDEQEPAGRGLHRQQRQVVLAEHARAHEPEQEPELAVGHPAIGQRHRRLGQPAARRDHLVEQVRLELADQRRERADVGANPAGPIDHRRALHDARQRRPQRGGERRDDPRHRVGVGRLGGPQLRPVEGARGHRPAGRPRCARPPASRRARVARRARRDARRTVAAAPTRRADQEPRLPDAVVAPRQARPQAGRRAPIDPTTTRAGSSCRDRQVDPLDVREVGRRTGGWRGRGTAPGRPS